MTDLDEAMQWLPLMSLDHVRERGTPAPDTCAALAAYMSRGWYNKETVIEQKAILEKKMRARNAPLQPTL